VGNGPAGTRDESPTTVAVLGLGYVGLPLVDAATDVGMRVIGIDPDAAKVAGLNAGRSHVDDLDDSRVATLIERGFHATSDPSKLAEADVVVITVPTPLREDGGPDLAAVEAATRSIATHVRPGALVVLESTTYPGTTEEVVQPLLEAGGLRVGTDLHLAFSPERIDPGNPTFGLRNTPKVVGGVTPACTETARAFYARFVDEVVVVGGTREAELAKLLENTYRHVNIALMNEMVVFCRELGIDLWDVIDAAATKPFGFQAFYPGPGVGGHCIPIDPNYLSYKVRTLGHPFRFVELAQEINDGMPAYVARRAQDVLNEAGRAVRGSRVLLLGVTYKKDIADERESPAIPVARRLRDLGADLSYHDPHVEAWSVDGDPVPRAELADGLREADLVVLLQAHSAYDPEVLAAATGRVLDTRGFVRAPGVDTL
jgi:nucleotide sugar dehydrogenase